MNAEELLELLRDFHIEATKKGLLQKRDKHNLSFIQRSLLKILSMKNHPVSMTKMCALLCVKKSAMTRIIDRMEKNNLVTRSDITGDRRSYGLALTEKGSALIPHLNTVPVAVLEKILSQCTPGEKKAVIEGYRTLLEKLREI